MRTIPEADWRYLRGLQNELLEEFSRRVCDEVGAVLDDPGISANEKRLRIYEMINQRDDVVAECFDDWRRSRAYELCWAMRRHGLLKPEHIEKLTPESQFAVCPFED